MSLEILRKIGLSEGEIRIYRSLLDLGSSPLNKIHEKTGIERRNIYDIINKLIEKGLVTYTEENKKRKFSISHPNKLLGYIEEKKKELDNTKNEISSSLPEIIEKFNTKKEDINSQIFRGAEGIKAVWDDMLNYKNIYWIGSGMYVPDKFPAFWESWNKRRIKRKVGTYHLFRFEKRGEVNKNKFPEAKFLPKEFSGAPTVTVIFGNKVAQFLFGENLFVFVIESKELAGNYRTYHKYLWDNVAKN